MSNKTVRSHTINGVRYKITQVHGLYGFSVVADKGSLNARVAPELFVLAGSDLEALDSLLHESMHALGVPARCLHDKDGNSTTRGYARLIWRMGWRKGGRQ